jgi:hypothetical protein
MQTLRKGGKRPGFMFLHLSFEDILKSLEAIK